MATDSSFGSLTLEQVLEDLSRYIDGASSVAVLLLNLMHVCVHYCACAFVQPVHRQHAARGTDRSPAGLLPNRSSALVLRRLYTPAQCSSTNFPHARILRTRLQFGTLTSVCRPSSIEDPHTNSLCAGITSWLTMSTSSICLSATHSRHFAKRQAYDSFLKYKLSVPVCGAILVSEDWKSCLVVKGMKSSNWGFPQGKINQAETEMDCAIREVRRHRLMLDENSHVV